MDRYTRKHSEIPRSREVLSRSLVNNFVLDLIELIQWVIETCTVAKRTASIMYFPEQQIQDKIFLFHNHSEGQ